MTSAAGFALDAYLERLGLGHVPACSGAGLSELHAAHVAAIPFENLDILLGRPIRLELEALEAKLVRARRGGYCFEQNTLLQAALGALGLPVTALAARVRTGSSALRPRTHMLLRVELADGPFLADVGFGADGLVRPLPFAEQTEVWLGGMGHRLVRETEALWVLQGDAGDGWQDLYAFTLEEQHAVDFEVANHFTSTWPKSPFVTSLTAQRCWPERRLVLRNRELLRREGRASRTETIRDPQHLLEVLDAEFGLCFPPGTRFSRPEFEPQPGLP